MNDLETLKAIFEKAGYECEHHLVYGCGAERCPVALTVKAECTTIDLYFDRSGQLKVADKRGK